MDTDDATAAIPLPQDRRPARRPGRPRRPISILVAVATLAGTIGVVLPALISPLPASAATTPVTATFSPTPFLHRLQYGHPAGRHRVCHGHHQWGRWWWWWCELGDEHRRCRRCRSRHHPVAHPQHRGGLRRAWVAVAVAGATALASSVSTTDGGAAGSGFAAGASGGSAMKQLLFGQRSLVGWRWRWRIGPLPRQRPPHHPCRGGRWGRRRWWRSTVPAPGGPGRSGRRATGL